MTGKCLCASWQDRAVASACAGPHLDGPSVYNALEDFQVNGTAGVPTVFLGLLEYMASHNKKLHYLKVAAIGGAACPPKILEKFDR